MEGKWGAVTERVPEPRIRYFGPGVDACKPNSYRPWSERCSTLQYTTAQYAGRARRGANMGNTYGGGCGAYWILSRGVAARSGLRGDS